MKETSLVPTASVSLMVSGMGWLKASSFFCLFRCTRPSRVPRGPATSTGSLASQRHPGKFPKVPGRRRGQVLCAQAWKPGSQHAGEKRGVAGLLLGRTERAARAAELQLCAQAR